LIRLYRDGEGGLRFAGKDPEAERRAARAILAERRSFEERLHSAHMTLLGEPTVEMREVRHLVRRREYGTARLGQCSGMTP
jgi:Tfp pilus assembly protein PilE